MPNDSVIALCSVRVEVLRASAVEELDCPAASVSPDAVRRLEAVPAVCESDPEAPDSLRK